MTHIYGEFYLDADDNCYMVGKKTVRRVKQDDGTTKETDCLKDIKYYGTLAQAIKGAYERCLRETVKETDGDVESLCKGVRRLHKAFMDDVDRAFPPLATKGDA